MERTQLIALLADKEHASQAQWVDALFARCEPLPDGSRVAEGYRTRVGITE